MAGSELWKIERLAAIFGRAGGGVTPGVTVAIGDDCAVLEGGLVWTIDEQVEGTHFRKDLVGWRDVGFRSFMAAASDLAAMGAAPWCALSALVLPPEMPDDAFVELAEGQRDAAREVGAGIVGGNLARGERASIATTLLGRAAKPVLRSGAKAGDLVWLAGHVGRAAAGLLALESGAAGLEEVVLSWRRPRALIVEGLRLSSAHAAIDVSDGLARDAGHVAKASGVRLVLDRQALETDELLSRAATALGASALDLALQGGEDYALVACGPLPIEGFRRIGEVTPGEGVALRAGGSVVDLAPGGFDHFG